VVCTRAVDSSVHGTAAGATPATAAQKAATDQTYRPVERWGEVHDSSRYAARFHDDTREHEEGDRHDDEGIEPVVDPLRNDGEREVGLGDDERKGGGDAEHEDDRHTDRQEDQEAREGEDQSGFSPAISSRSPNGWSQLSTTDSTVSSAR
jgi:hypothetical protein